MNPKSESGSQPSIPVGSLAEAPTVESLHAVFVELTGFEVGRSYSRDYAWHEFIKRGFTADDLKMVVFEIRRQIGSKARRPGALKFRNLIEQLDWFEDDLAEARANLRNRVKPATNKDRVLAQTGRRVETTGTARTVETVIRKLPDAPELTEAGRKALDDFRKMKGELKP